MKIRKGDVTCRRCKHGYHHHCVYLQVMQGGMVQQAIKPLEVVPCNGLDFMNGHPCGCIEFEPIDNLEYLEWKASQKDSQERVIDDTIW
jgi:hypothetical protein